MPSGRADGAFDAPPRLEAAELERVVVVAHVRAVPGVPSPLPVSFEQSREGALVQVGVVEGRQRHAIAAATADLHETRAADDDAPVGSVQFALGTLAMGDVNATVFAQSAHVALLRRFGAMDQSEMMVYRGLPPRGKTWEGVVIDDHAIAAVWGRVRVRMHRCPRAPSLGRGQGGC